ncbi:hypothetical protein [Sphingorhabdus sp.]|uniref:hypothetical protein n=1 Tax=Sphingorhabdus sp. TaxID=1902408 RepID=UPI003593D9DC
MSVMMDAVLQQQAELIAALDMQDADAIMAASSALSTAIEKLRLQKQVPAQSQLSHGLKQAEAARIRVKYLTAWNRQKIDRLAECRGLASSAIYVMPQKRA